ncbi:MAG TPA: c-type cytochrome [Casimicrobiaceae bacterium]|nr:c-type cytochrome [Casimicrobiaceae bacterium]
MHRLLTWISACAVLTAAPVHAQVPDAIKDKVAVCAACHGETGNNDNPQYPVLAGQSARYIYTELQDFKAGRRHDPNMDPVAQALSREDMLALADYFSKQKQAPSPFKADPQKVARGKAKADEVLCTMCHLGGFVGQNEIPRVAGQHYEYIKKQLSDFKARRRTNDAGNMTSVASTLSDQDIEDLAQYVTTLY